MGEKRLIYIILAVGLFVIFMSFLVTAGFSDWLNNIRSKITGEATSFVDFNITVGAGNVPQIINLTKDQVGSFTVTENGMSNITINFSVVDADGISNLNTLANVSLQKTGESRRTNTTCQQVVAVGNNANYTCQVDLWFFDDDGAWTVNATISDVSGNKAENSTTTFTVATQTGFILGPGNLSFSTLSPGAKNQTASTALTLNNTGNQDIPDGNIEINATTLAGESNSVLGLHSGNFTISNTTTAGKIQCDGGNNTAVVLSKVSGKSFIDINQTGVGTFANVTTNMSRGNHSINNGIIGQEQLYLCITLVGPELTQQSYSTSLNKPWTIQATSAA